jgi:antitoxin (DNA-binding transcriptional repressor) of toxin-antitoxin stability system
VRSVNIAALKNGLSRYLSEVRQGEELLIRDRKTPIAKIVPLAQAGEPEAEDLALAAEGKLRLPEAALPASFWAMPAPRVALKRVVAAVEAERDEE